MDSTKGGAALVTALIALIGLAPVRAERVPRVQEASNQQSSASPQDTEKARSEKKAALLLDQVVAEAGGLRLPENRIYVQISAGDLLWPRDEARARALFNDAANAIADFLRKPDTNDRRAANTSRVALQLRQELVIAAAQKDTALAYQLLQTMPEPQTDSNQRFRRGDPQSSLEQSLVAVIAANDPKTALKNAQGWLDRGEYPLTFPKVLSQLQQKESDSATKLAEQLVRKLQPDELLAKQDATRLATALLRPGPRVDKKTGQAAPSDAGDADRVLGESVYHDLLASVITAALRATPPAPGTAAAGRGGFRGGPAGPRAATVPQTDADIAQANARSLLSALQGMQQQVDAYAPERSLALRQKLSQMGIGDDQRAAFGQLFSLMQQGTSEMLMNAAATAPEGMQGRLYQRAAMKALDEGNADRAKDIANQHLDGNARDNMLHTVEMRQATQSATPNKMDEIRQTLSRAQSDDERVSLLLQFANALQAESPKLALQLLDEARGLVMRKATSYSQLEAQLNVAHAVAQVDPARAFETLEPGINQINELLSAAAVLNGFEVNLFKDGELPLQGGGSITATVMRYGAELASLAKIDFDRAQMMTDRFQLTEPRVLARLALVRGVFGAKPIESGARSGGRSFGGFGRRPE
jgi:hypothetical protein